MEGMVQYVTKCETQEDRIKMTNFIFTRSKHPFNGFQKLKKQKNRKAVENILKSESVLLSGLLSFLLTNFGFL